MAPEKKICEEKHMAKLMVDLGKFNPNPLLEVDFSGKVTFCNEAVVKILEETGLQEPNSFVPKDLEHIVNTIRQRQDMWFYREVRLGNRVFGEDLHGDISFQAVRIYGADITMLKKAEESRLLVAAIVESSDDAIIGKALDGKITAWNRGAERLYGYTAQEVLGQSIDILVPPNRQDEVPEILQKISRGENIAHYETVRQRRDGQKIPVSLTISPIKDAEERITGASTIARNITERKRDEEALKQAHDELEQKVNDRTAELRLTMSQLQEEVTNRRQTEESLKESEARLRHLTSQLLTAQEKERGRLALELHDDLGQSLAVLKMQLRAIQRKAPPESSETRESLEHSLNFTNEIIERIRRLSRNLRPTILEELGLTPAVKHLFKEFCQDIQVTLDLDDTKGLFSQEAQLNIYRIFQESFSNIAKYSQASRVSVSLKRQDESVTVQIEDNGRGFDPQKVINENITDRGLGLTAMDERARMLGGSLNIWSRDGQGTKITLTVPIQGK